MNWEVVDIPTHRLEHAKWVKAIAHIRKNETGEVRQYPTDEILEDGADHPITFNWAENNYSCDCNREIFFESAGGKECVPECGDGRFAVNLQNPVTGEFYYKEF